VEQIRDVDFWRKACPIWIILVYEKFIMYHLY